MSASTSLASQSSTMPTRIFTAASDNQYVMNMNNTPSETQSLQWGEYPQYKLIPIPGYNVSNPGINNSGKMNNYPCANNQLNYINPPNYFEATCDRYVTNVPNQSNMVLGAPHNGLCVTNMITPTSSRNGPGLLTTGSNSWMNSIKTGDRHSRPSAWAGNSKPNSGVKKPKRIRTAFTSQQMLELEQEYAKTRYLDRSRRIELSDILQLNERTIKIWFQNRRMKEKKDRAESMEDSETSTTESSPDMGAVNMAHICDQYQPTPPVNHMTNRPNLYVDYSNVGTARMIPQNCASMPDVPQNMFINTYPAFDNVHHTPVQLEAQLAQFQVTPAARTDPTAESKEEVLPDSSTNILEPSTDPAENDNFEQKWDFSWFRSVKIEEEF